MKRTIRKPWYPTGRTFRLVVIWTQDLHGFGVMTEPPLRRTRATSMSCKIEENGVPALDEGVVDEMLHEAIFNISLSSLLVRQQTNLISRDVQIVRQPSFDALSIIDASLKVPDVPGLILINSNNESEEFSSHRTCYRSALISGMYGSTSYRVGLTEWCLARNKRNEWGKESNESLKSI